MQQAHCDCGKNGDSRFFVYLERSRSGVETFVVGCPGCGRLTAPACRGELRRRREQGRASAGVEPVEVEEGRVS
jgi:hypothetical protein